jgi:hypothetical protein
VVSTQSTTRYVREFFFFFFFFYSNNIQVNVSKMVQRRYTGKASTLTTTRSSPVSRGTHSFHICTDERTTQHICQSYSQTRHKPSCKLIFVKDGRSYSRTTSISSPRTDTYKRTELLLAAFDGQSCCC